MVHYKFLYTIVFILIASTANASSLVHSQGWESGTGDWLLSGEYPTQTPVRSTDQAHGGSWSVKADHTAGVVIIRLTDLTPALSEVYVEYWWYVATTWNDTYDHNGVKFLHLTGEVDDQVGVNLWFSNSTWVLDGNVGAYSRTDGDWTGAAYDITPGGGTFSQILGNWFKIGIYAKSNTSGNNDGELKYWVGAANDDFNPNTETPRFSSTSFRWDNTDTATFNDFWVVSNIEDASGDCVNYLDDIEIWDGMPSGPIVLTGTAISGGVTEAEIVTGGETIIATVSGDTFVATACADNAITTAMLAGIDGSIAAQLTIDHTMCVRDSDTQITLTLPVTGGYDISATAEDTWTMPATALTGGEAIVATPYIVISYEAATTTPASVTKSATGAAVSKGSATAVSWQ